MTAGRRAIDLQEHKEQLVELFQGGLTYDQLKSWLFKEHGVTASVRTIKTWFKRWDAGRRLGTDVEEAIKERIQVLFYESGLKDREMLEAIRREGYLVGKYTFTRLRLELGLRTTSGKRLYERRVQKKASRLAASTSVNVDRSSTSGDMNRSSTSVDMNRSSTSTLSPIADK